MSDAARLKTGNDVLDRPGMQPTIITVLGSRLPSNPIKIKELEKRVVGATAHMFSGASDEGLKARFRSDFAEVGKEGLVRTFRDPVSKKAAISLKGQKQYINALFARMK